MASSQSGSSKLSSSSFDQFNSGLQGAALKATRNALSLPADLPFYRSVDSELSKELDAFSARVLSVTNSLLNLVTTTEASQSGRRRKGNLTLENRDDVLDCFQSLVVDSMEQLLERADISLDDHLGLIKPPVISVNPLQAQKNTNIPRGRLDPALQHASHLPKPQLLFKKKIDNNDNLPWVPMLPHKYNAQVPLGYNYLDSDGNTNTSLHPYQYEIKHITYPISMFQTLPPIPPKSFDETPFSWVSTPSEFAVMLDKLRSAKEIAVDLEHHNYRSWSGFLCLMQISTRVEDFVVDTLLLRDELQELNEVFTNPAIVKVFHGAESDIIWLQQDFSLYIVNLFDTFHASKLLEFSRHGLANLLESYCDIIPDKRYQLADWRIRPLTEEMLSYARSDTHFLLYIYDNLRNTLLDRAKTSFPEPSASVPTDCDPAHVLIYEVLARSEDTSLRVYEKEVYDAEGGSGPGGWDTLAKKWNKGMLMKDAPWGMQREIYKRLHAWRDRVAREEDESRPYILMNNSLFQLAERPPGDMASLLAAFKYVPPVIRRRAKELLDTIQNTIKEHRETASAIEVTDQTDNAIAPANVEMDVPVTAEVPISSTVDALNSRLWSQVPVKPSAPLSTLFGSTLGSASNVQGQMTKVYSASTSNLFSDKLQTLPERDAKRSFFKDVASRIHRTLVIAPLVPKVNKNQAMSDPEVNVVELASDKHPSGSTEQIEIPFIPAAQRRSANTIDDTIVVVGQARQKKRKHLNVPITQDSESEAVPLSGIGVDTLIGGNQSKKSNKKKRDREDDGSVNVQEPFDYSTVPNILDDVPTPEPGSTTRRKKKQKQNKADGVIQYGNFPAPPKAHRELKSGNQSYTFK